MIYLYTYLGIGALVLTGLLLEGVWAEPAHSRPFSKRTDPSRPTGGSFGARVLSDWGIPLVACTAIVIGWPVAVYFVFDAHFGPKARSEKAARKGFMVTRAHLVEHLTVAQIEAREVVADPLGAVPALPFGHLNSVWVEFVSGARPGDEVWSFTAPWRTRWGGKEIRSGYVLVRKGVPGRYVMSAFRPICLDAEGARSNEVRASTVQ